MAGVPWDDYYGPGSPLERLVEAGGKVLRLGADPNTVTLHPLRGIPRRTCRDKRRVRRHRRVRGADGPEMRVVECLDDSNGIVDWPGEDYFSVILADYLAAHAVTARGQVGSAAERTDRRARPRSDFAARVDDRTFRATRAVAAADTASPRRRATARSSRTDRRRRAGAVSAQF